MAAAPTAGRSPPLLRLLLCLFTVTCATHAGSELGGATSREVAPLRALRSEEGSIDEVIRKIEKLRQHRKQQQQSVSAPPSEPSRSPGEHPPRKFAYYPNDPEYRVPRPPENPTGAAAPRERVTSQELHHTSGHKGAAGSKLATPAASGADATGSPRSGSLTAPGTATGIAGPVTPPWAATMVRSRGDPETVLQTAPSQPLRYKKAQADTQLLKVQPDALLAPAPSRDNTSDVYFIVTVAGICCMAVGVTVAGGYCYHRLQKRAKAAGDAEYPAYGVTGPSRDLSPSGDRKLAQSAQMYHYQHQKQQMMAMEKTHNGRHGSASDVDSEEENEEGDYTVYECPGLAPTGEMEVKNPLFHDDATPAPSASTAEPAEN